MNRRSSLLAIALVLTLTAGTRSFSALAASPTPKFLPPGKAFHLSVKPSRNEVHLRFTVAPGYALYKKRILLRLLSSGATLGKFLWPTPIVRHDPFFGTELIYRGRVKIAVPLTCSTTTAHPIRLEVRYQGCADAGLCYPPITKRIRMPTSSVCKA